MEENKRNNNGTIGVLGALLVLAVAGLIYLYLQNRKITQQFEQQTVTVDSLYTVRDGLAREVDSLQTEYLAVAIENDSLKGSLENAKEIISDKNNQIWRTQRNAQRNAETLQAEITALQSSKEQLMTTIAALETENEELKQANVELTQQVETFKTENMNLQGQVQDMTSANQMLESRMSQLIDASFKASALEVDALRKNGKTTLRARQVEKLNVGFDLVDIPKEFHGNQSIYLTITNQNGVNPFENNTEVVKVGNQAQALVIEPIDTKKVNLNASQRIEFSYELQEKLDKEFYVVSVYSDRGLLGSTLLKLY